MAVLTADDRADDVFVTRPPVLGNRAARLLSSLPQEASTRLSDVIGTGTSAGSLRKHVHSLIRHGLVEWSGTRNKRIVRLTNLGREHPQYDASSPKTVPLRATIVATDNLRLLLAIHALGEARSFDLTLVLNLGRGRTNKGGATGRHIQRLRDVGFIEPANSKKGQHPPYRLTPVGISYIATIRSEIEFPDAEELRAKLKYERQQHLNEHGRRVSSTVLSRSKPKRG